MTAEAPRRLIWDWTIRLFHWLIVLIIPLMWWTAEEGYMDWHRRLGMTMFTLILFRLIWGLIGTWTARFGPMIRRLGSLGDYIRDLRSGAHMPAFGHGPLGVLSVFALLLGISIQVSTGLFAVDVDGLESGPLAVLISFDLGRELAEIHELNFNILSGLILLHIAAILFYRFRLRDHLVKPMVTGKRAAADFGSQELPENRMRLVPLLIAVILTAASVYAVLEAG